MMSCCDHCRDADTVFSRKTARWDLLRYHKLGPRKSTRLLLNGLQAGRVSNRSLLDIGGGVGIIQSELFPAGLAQAVQVDASSKFLKASKDEASRRGYADRAEFIYGDFVELAPHLADADIVTLDRVICCYPDMPRLVGSSLEKAGELYGVVYPRNRWFVQAALRAGNLWFRLSGSEFRTWLHPGEEIDALICKNGFGRYYTADTIFWRVAVYRREKQTPK